MKKITIVLNAKNDFMFISDSVHNTTSYPKCDNNYYFDDNNNYICTDNNTNLCPEKIFKKKINA